MLRTTKKILFNLKRATAKQILNRKQLKISYKWIATLVMFGEEDDFLRPPLR